MKPGWPDGRPPGLVDRRLGDPRDVVEVGTLMWLMSCERNGVEQGTFYTWESAVEAAVLASQVLGHKHRVTRVST